MIQFLKGKKTYLLAAALLAYTVGGYFSGNLSMQDALGLLFSSGVIASLRAAITKVSVPPSTPQS
jgi:hypothetical protein